MRKNMNKGKEMVENPSPLYQTDTQTDISKHINLKVDNHTGDKCFIHGPKHRKENHAMVLEKIDSNMWNV